MRIGELFSGYGGLGMGVQSVLGGEIAWHSEIDPGACKILAHRYPDVPNLGDITAVDWSQVEPVDVLTGGFPCQDVSAAGKRAGIKPGTRSGLWSEMHRAIVALRPSLVVIENVRGLLSATAQHPAHGDVEPCPWCMGDDEPVSLRALGAVLGDLADSGFHARWAGLRAADVGAPHGRFRVFVVAWPAADAGSEAVGLGAGLRTDEPRRLRRGRPDNRGASEPATDPSGGELQRRGVDGDVAGAPGTSEGDRGEREWHGDAADDRRAVAADADNAGRREHCGPFPVRAEQPPAERGRRDAAANTFGGGRPWGALVPVGVAIHGTPTAGGGEGDLDGEPECACGAGWHGGISWGQYEPAIRRWEGVLGRPAPPPTEPGRSGPRLSPRFVEWMMGLPAGWVTDVPGITRNEALKALGNGVVPQQAAAALRLLLAAEARAAA